VEMVALLPTFPHHISGAGPSTEVATSDIVPVSNSVLKVPSPNTVVASGNATILNIEESPLMSAASSSIIPVCAPVPVDSWKARRLKWIAANPRPGSTIPIAQPITEAVADNSFSRGPLINGFTLPIAEIDIVDAVQALSSQKRKYEYDKRLERQVSSKNNDFTNPILSITDLTHICRQWILSNLGNSALSKMQCMYFRIVAKL
jgi:hypothetical protein